MYRIEMVGVDPDTSSLDSTGGAVGCVQIARPYASGEAVAGIIGDAHGIIKILEAGDRNHRAENLLAENPHGVIAFKDGWLDIIAIVKLATGFHAFAAGAQLGI